MSLNLEYDLADRGAVSAQPSRALLTSASPYCVRRANRVSGVMRSRFKFRPWVVLLALAAVGCSNSQAPNITAPSPLGFPPSLPGSAVGAVLVGAGDIAACGNTGSEETARLLDAIDGVVFTAGDNAYEDGTVQEYRDCYDLTWGRHKARTRPSPGNHEYQTPAALPYYSYFGAIAGLPGLGYYGYDVGAWHIVSLNSNVAAGPGSAQYQWLQADLAVSRAQCTMAYWHHPVFSSGEHGNDPQMQPIWRLLYDHGTALVINGHDHDYERFALQDPDGRPDPTRGIREIISGTGGRSLRAFPTMVPNSEVRSDSTYGVLKLTLGTGTYAWEFVPVAGGSFRDAGSGSCRAAGLAKLTASAGGDPFFERPPVRSGGVSWRFPPAQWRDRDR